MADVVKPPRWKPQGMETWSVEEATQFLSVAGESTYGPTWLLALTKGLRKGELLGLRWQDVELAKGVLRVCQSTTTVKSGDRFTLPKTASGRRTIALGAPCVAALREHRARQNARRLALGAAW